MPPTPLTPSEWNALFPKYFPGLIQGSCGKTDGETGVYNCIAWAMGITNKWIDPPESTSKIDNLCKGYGFQICQVTDPSCTIRWYYLTSNNEYTHADRYNMSLSSWESKLGEEFRMIHNEKGLEDTVNQMSAYGTVVRFYKKTVPMADLSAISVKTDDEVQKMLMLRTNSLKESYARVDSVFEGLFNAWKGIWYSGAMKFQQSSSSRAQGPEWNKLVAYGRSISVLPQIVSKLSDPTNLFAVELYNALQNDSTKKVSPTDVLNYYVLNNQAALIQKYYGSLVIEFDRLVNDWQSHQDTVRFSSKSNDYLKHVSYDKLVQMGKPIVPLIMERYAHDQAGWWHELLYEIETGTKSSAASFSKADLFEQWKNSYELGKK